MSRPSTTGGSTASSAWHYHCAAIVLSIVILLSGLRVASSAPTSDQDWWINPCNKQPVLRHSRSPAETQLKRFLLEMNTTFFKEIKQLYKSFTPNKFKGKCPKIRKNLDAVQNAPTLTAATQAFYDTLLQFAAFIDKLKNTTVKTKGEFDTAKRKHIFEEAKENLKLLICEYNETLSRQKKDETHLDVPKKSMAHKKGFKFHMKCLPDTMDHTQAHFMDIDFFKKLQKFLKQGRTFLRKKKAKKPAGGRKGRKNRVNSEQFIKLETVTDIVRARGRKSRH